MEFADLSDEYILDIVSFNNRLQIAFSLCLVNRQFHRVCQPFCHQYGAHLVRPIRIDFNDQFLPYSLSLPFTFKQQAQEDGSPHLAISRPYTWEEFCANANNGRYIISINKGTHCDVGWQCIPFAQDPAPSNILGFRGLFTSCPSRSNLQNRFNFIAGKYLQFFEASKDVFKSPKDWFYLIRIHSAVLDRLMLHNSEDILNKFFKCFVGCNHGRGLKLYIGKCRDDDADDYPVSDFNNPWGFPNIGCKTHNPQPAGVDEIFDTMERLLSIGTILEECSKLVISNYKCNSRINVNKLVDWLHFQQGKNSLHIRCLYIEFCFNFDCPGVEAASQHNDSNADSISDRVKTNLNEIYEDYRNVINNCHGHTARQVYEFIYTIIEKFFQTPGQCAFNIKIFTRRFKFNAFHLFNKATEEVLELQKNTTDYFFHYYIISRHSIRAEIKFGQLRKVDPYFIQFD